MALLVSTFSKRCKVARGTHIYSSFDRMIATFGIGAITPYRLVLEPATGAPGSVLTSEFWKSSQFIIQQMVEKLPSTDASNFEFMSYST